MSGLSREVLRWLQSLDLTWQIKTPKWDLTNGYLIAEIFSWYFPMEIQMHMYNNGTSLDSKLRNWSLLKIFIKRHNLEVPESYIEGTIHCKEGAAQLLVETMYELLTCRQIRKQATEEIDFTDEKYQSNLPMHARSTATQAVKNNLRNTELIADKNLIQGQQKIRKNISVRPKRPGGKIMINNEEAQSIINTHLEHRRQARLEDPGRFNIKPTLGELAVRRAPPAPACPPDPTEDIPVLPSPPTSGLDMRSPTVQFKEVTVKQLSRTSMKSIPVS